MRLNLAFIVAMIVSSFVALPFSNARLERRATSSSSASVVPNKQVETTILQGNTSRAKYFLDSTMWVTQDLQPGCFNCTVAEAGKPDVSPQCRAAYEDVYEDQVIDITFSLGYMDFNRITEDLTMRAAIAEKLAPKGSEQPPEECPEGVFACGFVRDEDDATLFTKTIQGPDGKDRLVKLRLDHSSSAPIESANRGKCQEPGFESPKFTCAQMRRSKKVTDEFFRSMGERPASAPNSNASDIVFYLGHGRNGAGFSFEPPEMLNGSVNYAGYYNKAKNQINRRRMLSAIAGTQVPPKFVGIFACNADEKFAEDVRATSRGRTSVAASSDLVSPDAALSQAFGTLDSLLAMRCEDTFEKAMFALDRIDETKIKKPRLMGFFDRAPRTNAEPPQSTDPPLRVRTGESIVTPSVVTGGVIAPPKPEAAVDPELEALRKSLESVGQK